MLNARALIALASLALGAGCADDHPSTTSESEPIAAEGDGGTLDFESFDRALEQAIAEHNAQNPNAGIAGASAVVVDQEHGIVHQKGYGAYGADRLYLIASASKILSVGVLMRLADQGKLDLDAPISNYLSAWGAHKTNVTVAQLVSNSSGLPDLGEISTAARSSDPAVAGKYLAHYCQYQEAGSLASCGRSIYGDDAPDNNRAPDTVFRYGGSQWQLAGAIAEVVSGKSWAELIQETYVTPCQVPSLGYTNQFEKNGLSYPATFQANAANLPVTQNPSIEGGAYVTPADYGKLLWMHLRGGKCGDNQVLSEAAVARMQKDRVGKPNGYSDVGTRNPNLPGYGLGWWVNEAQGYVADPGAYGAYPLLDQKRRYAAYIVIEVTSDVGGKLAAKTKPVLDAIFDARN